jgi:hypothetical protein
MKPAEVRVQQMREPDMKRILILIVLLLAPLAARHAAD